MREIIIIENDEIRTDCMQLMANDGFKLTICYNWLIFEREVIKNVSR